MFRPEKSVNFSAHMLWWMKAMCKSARAVPLLMGSSKGGTAGAKVLPAAGVSTKHMRVERLIHGHLTLPQRLRQSKGGFFVAG
ncbi:MAG: hypothetical protein AAF468_20400 [Pseudomonadota bacterium]